MTILLLFISLLHASEPLILYPGSSHQIPSPRTQKITVEKKGLLTLKDQGSTLKLIGKKTGSTRMHVGTKTYEVHVLRESSHATYQKLKKWQIGKLGPQLFVESGKIYVRGSLYTFLDWQQLSEFLDTEDEVIIQAQADKALLQQVQEHLKKLSNENNIPFGVFHTQPDWEIIFSNSEKQDVTAYKKVFKKLGIQVSQSANALTSVPMIEVNILAAEVRRGEMSKFGVQWPQTAQVQLVPKFGLDPNSIFVNVDLFEQQGWGKVLASPTLMAQSGEEATFHSGGEMPIKNSNQFNASVTWKRYGIILKIKPRADFAGKMSIDIECEVSMIDAGSAVDGVPGLLMNRMSSHFNLSESKTIALSGLIKEEWGKSQQGLPGFKNIPIFSQLFSSTNYLNNQTELMFFVTPRIVK